MIDRIKSSSANHRKLSHDSTSHYRPLEDLIDIEGIAHKAQRRPYEPALSDWENVIYAIAYAFAALIEEFELARKELSYAEINNFPSLQASLQICKKILGDLLRKELPLAAEAEKYLQLKVWGRVRTAAGHIEREEPYRFEKIPKEPDELDRKIQAEMLKRDIKWP